jgi:peroxiredoxin
MVAPLVKSTVTHLARAARVGLFGAALMAVLACDGSTKAPRFVYTELDGSRKTSDTLAGKVVVVNFWATTCAPCLVEMPQFAALHTRMKSRGLETLAVAMRHDPPASVAYFAESRQLPFPVVIDNTGAVAEAFGAVEATPTTVVIDRRGYIVSRFAGMADFAALEAQLQRLLASS